MLGFKTHTFTFTPSFWHGTRDTAPRLWLQRYGPGANRIFSEQPCRWLHFQGSTASWTGRIHQTLQKISWDPMSMEGGCIPVPLHDKSNTAG